MGKAGGEDDGWRSGFAGRIEIRESGTGRRKWPETVKGRIVRESLEPGASVKEVAQRHGIPKILMGFLRRFTSCNVQLGRTAGMISDGRCIVRGRAKPTSNAGA